MINSKLDIQVWRLLSSCCCLKLRHHIEIEEAGDKGTWHFSNRLVIVLNGFIILTACLADTVFRTLFLNLKSLEVLAGFQLRIFLGHISLENAFANSPCAAAYFFRLASVRLLASSFT